MGHWSRCRHAVAITVEFATGGIHLRARGCAGAFVDVIGDAVAVVILGQRAAGRIHGRTCGCAGALVEIVGDPVAIAVDNAACGCPAPRILEPESGNVIDRLFVIVVGRETAARADVAAQLKSAAVAARAAKVDQQADAVQGAQADLIRARLENAANAAEAEAQVRIHPAFAVENPVRDQAETLQFEFIAASTVVL